MVFLKKAALSLFALFLLFWIAETYFMPAPAMNPFEHPD